MEVATVLFSDRRTIVLFDQFIYTSTFLELNKKDKDTAFFDDKTNNQYKLYYHYLLNNPDEEFIYNYTREDASEIKGFYCEKEFYMFDLSYSSEDFLSVMLLEYKRYLAILATDLIADILISHPFNGIKKLIEMK